MKYEIRVCGYCSFKVPHRLLVAAYWFYYLNKDRYQCSACGNVIELNVRVGGK